jgi:hypothetical protein
MCISAKTAKAARLTSKRAKTQAERIADGMSAERELPGMRAACAGIRAHLLEAIVNSPIDATVARERLYMAVNVLPQLEQMLIAAITDGVAANHEIEISKIMQVEE